jgi:hypothetical protein
MSVVHDTVLDRLKTPFSPILTDHISPPDQLARFPESYVVGRQKPSIKHNLESLMRASCEV